MFEKLHAFFAAFFAPVTAERDALLKAKEDAPIGSVDALRAELALAKFDIAHMKDAAPKRLHVKDVRVSLKGGINLMGLRQYPVNLYVAELEAIVEAIENGKILRFLEENRASLSVAKPVEEK